MGIQMLFKENQAAVCVMEKWIRKENGITMSFPAFSLKPVPVTDLMTKAFGAKPKEAFFDRDLLCVFDSVDAIKNMNPNEND